MTTLAIAAWHNRPDLLMEQVLTYNAAFNGDVIHLIHVNSDFQTQFWDEAKTKGVSFDAMGNIHFVQQPLRTYYAGILHAFIHCVQIAIRRNFAFEHVYFHTSSDLMARPDFDKHIRQFDIGLAQQHSIEVQFVTDPRGDTHVLLPHGHKDFWKERLHKDKRIVPVLRSMGTKTLRKSRAEGSFFRRDLFFEIMFPLLSHIGIREMYAPENAYPLEEYMFAQCVEFYCERHKVRRAPHAVVTTNGPKRLATIQDISALAAKDGRYGIKRFSDEIDSPERDHVRKLLGIR